MYLGGVRQLCLLFLAFYSLSLPAPDLPEGPPAAEAGTGMVASLRKASSEGLTYLRIHLVASDEELPHVLEAIEEAEHALEPPSEVEGFWRRKRHILYRHGSDVVYPFTQYSPPRALDRLLWENPPAAFDLQRSFQNARRLLRLSEDFPSPWLRQLMLNSATMFAITHGGEFVTGTVEGTRELLHGNIGGALAWYGLAIPGLYDFGCWIGQGLIFVKPTRNTFDFLRRSTIFVAGRAVKYVGLTRVVEFVFERPEVRKQLAELIKNRALRSKKSHTFELFVEDEALLRFSVRDKTGREAIRLRFDINERGEMVLREADLHESAVTEASYASLKNALRDFGWNVLGAFRQIRKLLCRNQPELIEREKTFITTSESSDGGYRHLEFRPNAVLVRSKLRLSEALKNWASDYKSCVLEMLRYYSPVFPMPPPDHGMEAE
ncbi:MAG: hypothetical protein R3B54_12985 [Bdellovibrionota bacterium]